MYAEPPLTRLGLSVGHHTDADAKTGMTVFISRSGASIGIDIPGGNTGTLNTPAFHPGAFASHAHGVVLTGGSTYGLESAFGVMR
jgi:L-aminopeptidase/D-esterase-like protein